MLCELKSDDNSIRLCLRLSIWNYPEFLKHCFEDCHIQVGDTGLKSSIIILHLFQTYSASTPDEIKDEPFDNYAGNSYANQQG